MLQDAITDDDSIDNSRAASKRVYWRVCPRIMVNPKNRKNIVVSEENQNAASPRQIPDARSLQRRQSPLLANEQHHGGRRQKSVGSRKNPKPGAPVRVVRISGVMHTGDKKISAVAAGQESLQSVKEKKRFAEMKLRD